MASSPKFHLVDCSGNPLDERYEAAAEELHETFFNAFPQLCDPAVVSNTVEKSARKVARYEQKYGRVDNLPPFFLRVFSNAVKSLFRQGYSRREEIRTDAELEVLAGFSEAGSAANIERLILVKEALALLDERQRRMLILESQGYEAKDIAHLLGMSAENVYTALHRARKKLKKVFHSSTLPPSD